MCIVRCAMWITLTNITDQRLGQGREHIEQVIKSYLRWAAPTSKLRPHVPPSVLSGMLVETVILLVYVASCTEDGGRSHLAHAVELLDDVTALLAERDKVQDPVAAMIARNAETIRPTKLSQMGKHRSLAINRLYGLD
jgi:hypothetical protein